MENSSTISHYLDWSDKNKHGIIRYLIGTILVFFSFMVLSAIGIMPIALYDPNYQNSLVESNLALLSCFIAPFILIPLITHWLHQRPTWSVAMPVFKFDFRNLFVGFFISLLVGVVYAAVFESIGVMDIQYKGINWSNFIPLFFIGGIGLFVQTATEELLFRGYLTQFMHRIFKNPIFFISIPSLLFAYMHIGNIAKFNGGLTVMIPYFISAVLYGWTAYKSGSLWMAIGLHWSNNFSGMLLIGTNGDVLKSAAPFVAETPSLEMVSIVTLIQALTTIILIHFYLKNKKQA
jgi:membrane protease YdiL (CAAX protease family)|nr:type II CAAX endopeptidase family protein [uncultured Flavobacterium sp.]